MTNDIRLVKFDYLADTGGIRTWTSCGFNGGSHSEKESGHEMGVDRAKGLGGSHLGWA
jgi:hypothetical protein